MQRLLLSANLVNTHYAYLFLPSSASPVLVQRRTTATGSSRTCSVVCVRRIFERRMASGGKEKRVWKSSGERTRRDGLPILEIGGIKLCQFHMRGQRCPHEAGGVPCKMLHVDKDERPACPNFAACGVCKFGADCWYPHIRAVTSDRAPNLGVQVHGSHSQRLHDFLVRQPGCHVVGTAAVSAGRKSVKTLLLHIEGDVAAFASTAIIGNTRLRAAVTRVYPISCSHPSLHEAVQQALCQALPLADKTFRLQAFPRALERTLGDGAQSVCECCSEMPGHKIRLEAKGASHVLSVVLSAEVYYVGIAPREDFLVSWVPPPGAVGGAHAEASGGEEGVCKAYYKLCEALQEAAAQGRAPPQGQFRAVDIGASPGGWTQCLLEHGAAHVIAIDPGDVSVEPGALMAKVEHVRAKVQDCVGDLCERGQQQDVVVCDMNCSPHECVELLLQLRPLLRSGALAVITFKKFSESGKCTRETYRSDQERALELLAAVASDVSVVHLFANTLEERTVIASLP